MKRLNYLAIVLLTLSSCAKQVDLVSPKQTMTVTTNDEVTGKLVEFFNNKYKLTTLARNKYTDNVFVYEDMVSSDARVSLKYDESYNISEYTSIVSSEGAAYQEYLDISNEVQLKEITTSTVSFIDAYGSPLAKLTTSIENVNKYFAVESNGEGYCYKATPLALSKCSNNFATFFEFADDTFKWNTKTVQQYVESLVVFTDNSGLPESMQFTIVKKDKYGGIKVEYISNLDTITEVPSIAKVASTDDEATKKVLYDSLVLLGDSINAINFTQTISSDVVPTESKTYHNYYSVSPYGYGTMICDIPFDGGTTYGDTYIGVGYSYFYGYYMQAASPSASYTGATSNEYYDTLYECMPKISALSNEFFNYNTEKGRYVFDLKDRYFNDYAFSFSVLECLFGLMDPLAVKFGYYLSNNVNYAMDLHTLEIEVDSESGLPTFYLEYVDVNDKTIVVTSSFSDFGTTNVAKNPDANLRMAYSLILGE